MSDQLVNKEFTNWVKTSCALEFVKEGLFGYVKSKMAQLADKLVRRCGDEGHRIRFLEKVTVEGRIRKTYQTKHNGEFKWKMETDCRECAAMFDDLTDVLDESYKDVRWKCHATSSIPSKYVFWRIICNIFIPYDIEDAFGPEEIDPLAVFKLMMNCTLFVHVKHGVNSLIDLRNRLMHSKDNTLSEEDMKAAFINIKHLLRDETVRLTSQDAIAEIERLENKELKILDVDEDGDELVKRALHLKKRCLENDIKAERSRDNSTKICEMLLQNTISEIVKEADQVKGKERRQSEQMRKLKSDLERMEKGYENEKKDKERYKTLSEELSCKVHKSDEENVELLKEKQALEQTRTVLENERRELKQKGYENEKNEKEKYKTLSEELSCKVHKFEEEKADFLKEVLENERRELKQKIRDLEKKLEDLREMISNFMESYKGYQKTAFKRTFVKCSTISDTTLFHK